MNERSIPVSFRLPAAFARKLDEQGATLSISRGDYARRLVVEGLTDSRWQELRTEVGELRDQLDRLRADLKNAVGALLIKAGKADVDEARRFVSESLNA